ncbi:hypothetical protein PFISCL1PPCAC_3701, partial [Pristionchus fissidentatus]
MLWLRHEEYPELQGLTINNAFEMDGHIYLTSGGIHKDWMFYSLNSANLTIKEVPVFYSGDLVPVAENPVIAYKQHAFTRVAARVIKGTLEADGFHWTIAETTGPGPRDYESASCSIVDGDTVRYATVTCDYWRDNYEEEIWYLCELDLATMEWTRRMIIMDEEVFACFRRCFTDIDVYASGGRLHLLCTGSLIGYGCHFILDLSTMIC